MKLTQKKVAEKIGITQQAISKIINGSTPLWQTAKKLSDAVPGTDPVFWMEATPEQKKQALKNS